MQPAHLLLECHFLVVNALCRRHIQKPVRYSGDNVVTSAFFRYRLFLPIIVLCGNIQERIIARAVEIPVEHGSGISFPEPRAVGNHTVFSVNESDAVYPSGFVLTEQDGNALLFHKSDKLFTVGISAHRHSDSLAEACTVWGKLRLESVHTVLQGIVAEPSAEFPGIYRYGQFLSGIVCNGIDNALVASAVLLFRHFLCRYITGSEHGIEFSE